jgi:hypothetical protein
MYNDTDDKYQPLYPYPCGFDQYGNAYGFDYDDDETNNKITWK